MMNTRGIFIILEPEPEPEGSGYYYHEPARDLLTCSGPASLVGRVWASLTLDDLNCNTVIEMPGMSNHLKNLDRLTVMFLISALCA